MRVATLALATFLAIPSAAPGQAGASEQPTPSPDGRCLAFIGTRAGGERPFVIDVDDAPAWFPDGSQLAFQSDRTGTMQVWIMNADGSSPRQLTGISAP